jgi:Bacterial Ig-like domain (group 3)/FG-GAP-like repeat
MTSQRTMRIDSRIFRCFTLTGAVLIVLLALAAAATAQNPVPFIDQPLVPDAAAPGGAGFTLTINGAGFVATSTVNWNGSPRATTFVSSSQLTATILASDITTASTAAVTVVNPSPVGVSNTQFFSIAIAGASVSFLPATTYYTYANSANNESSLAIADVNGDGKPDLIVANGNVSDNYTVLLGNGNGTFQSPLVTSLGAGSIAVWDSVAVADVNGDGRPDLIISACCESNGHGEAAVLLGNGDGTFQAPVFYDSGGGLGGPLAVADLTGNGILDIAIANWDNNTVGVLLGNGDGTFQTAVTSTGPFDPTCLVIADVNKAGTPDVLICSDNSVALMLGNGNGTFQPPTTYYAGFCDGGVAVADFNGDGAPDLAIGNQGSGSCTGVGFVGVLLGNGNGTFQTEVNYGSGGPVVTGVAAADLKGDGTLDLVAFNGGSLPGLGNFPGSVGVLPGNGDGTFQTATPYSSAGYGSGAVVVADLNGDGRPDIVVTNSESANVAVLLNNSGPRTTTITTLTSSENPAGLSSRVTYTAIVTGLPGQTPTGTMTFYDGSVVVATVALSGGQAAYTTPYKAVGTHVITATYSGDSNNSGSTSTLTEQIEDTSKTAVISSGSPSAEGQPVTFTATVTSLYGAIPNGETVTFYDDGIAIGTGTTTGGVAIFTTSSLTAKTHTITAIYPGDATFVSSSGTVKQVVIGYATSTALASSLNPSIYGQKVTWTATVTTSGPIPPGGTVNFDWGVFSIGSANLNSSGVATLTRSNLSADAYPLTAVYMGDANHAGSASPILNQVITQATSSATLTSSPNPSTQGQSVTFTAKITSPTTIPSGPVTFTAGKTTLGTVELTNGKATLATSTLAVGSTTVTVTYPWNSDIAGSSASVTQVVQQ